MVFCSKCGQQVPGGAKFCQGCGEPVKLAGGSDSFLPGNVGVISSADDRDKQLSIAMGGATFNAVQRGQATASAPRNLGTCRGCGRAAEGQAVEALGGVYHRDCFSCAGGCGVNFFKTGKPVLEKNGKPYCDACHTKLEGVDVCHGCNKPATGTKMKALGALWHPQCFVCGKCGQGFPDKKFQNRDGRPFHTTCK